jgi:hypothetical protein
MMAGVFSEYLQQYLFLNLHILKGADLDWYLNIHKSATIKVGYTHYTLKSDLKFCAVFVRIVAWCAGIFLFGCV